MLGRIIIKIKNEILDKQQSANSPSENVLSVVDKRKRTDRLCKYICQLFGGRDGSDLHETGFEVFSEPVIFDRNTVGARSHFGGIRICKRKTCLVVLEDGGYDDRMKVLVERKRRGDFIQYNESERGEPEIAKYTQQPWWKGQFWFEACLSRKLECLKV